MRPRTNSVILSTAARYLLPLMILFSIFVLMRGHNQPGGGFVGGLVASAALALYAIAYDVQGAREVLRIDPRRLIGFGLMTSLGSTMISLLAGKPLMTGTWLEADLPIIGHFGTPAIFDIGVYLVVIGVTLTIIFTLAQIDSEEK